MSDTKSDNVWIEFFTPSEIKSFELPPNLILVGDAHIQRGAFCVIGGPPGVGKSRAVMALAIAGAKCENWFDLPIKKPFRTMIIQNENGKARLKKDLETVNCGEFEQWIRVCSPPPFGFAFEESGFVEALREKIKEFSPDVVIFDPWNAVAGDDKQSDYLKAFKLIREVVPVSDTGAAIVIVAHTRKPRDDEKATGRDLIHLLSGSHVLVSVPRTVFVMVPETPDVDSERIIFTCCKNNDGTMNAPTVWLRRDLTFTLVGDFNPQTQTENKRKTITVEDLKRILELNSEGLRRKHLVEILKNRTGASSSACYAAIEPDGKFKDNIEVDDDTVKWRD